MKSAVALAVLSLVMVGCDDLEFDADIEVLRPLTLVNEDGKTRSLSMGRYSGEVEFESDDRKIELEINGIGGKDEDFKFKIPKHVVLPENGGSFVIPAAENRQGVDLSATLTKQVTDSEMTRQWEHCTLYRTEIVVVKKIINGRVVYVRERVTVSYPGRQLVDSYMRTVHREMLGQLLEPSTQETMLTVRATDTNHNRIVVSRGPCY